MQLPNPKELKALLKICRDFGVSDVSFGEIAVKFGEMPNKSNVAEEIEETLPGQPSAEEMAYWSAAPDPLAAMVGQ